MSSNPSISWKKRPKFNPSRLPKFRSEENAWESVKSHRQHYHDAMHKVENVVSEVTVARGAKLKNYETPEVHLVLPKRKKYSSIINKNATNNANNKNRKVFHQTYAPHFHTVKRTRNKVWNKLATPTPKANRKEAISQAIINALKTNTSRKPMPPTDPKKLDRLSVKQRVAVKVGACQNDPSKAQELRERINKIVKQKAIDLFYYSKGKNAIAEHKKIVHTFSPEKRREKIFIVGKQKSDALKKVKKNRKRVEKEIIKRRLDHANKNARLKKIREEKGVIQQSKMKLLCAIKLASRSSVWWWKLEEGRLLKKAKLRKIMAARAIQEWWKKMLEKAESDARIKFFAETSAARTIQRFYKRYVCKSSGLHAEKSVEIVKRFLIDYQKAESNFSKLVKRYRYKAITVQRLWRRFARISKARLKVLGKMWDAKESQIIVEVYNRRIKSGRKMKAAQKKAMAEDLEARKKNSSKGVPRRTTKKKKKKKAKQNRKKELATLEEEEKKPEGVMDDTKSNNDDNIDDMEEKAAQEESTKNAIMGGTREKRLSLPPEEVRKLMMETLKLSDRKPEPGEIGAAAKGPKSMKVDRKVRMKLLKRCLREKRTKFREDIPELKRKERKRQLKSLRFTMDEVRTLVQNDSRSNRKGSKLLNDKLSIMGNERLVYRALMLYVYSILKPKEIEHLIEEGIEMTEAMYTKKSEKEIRQERKELRKYLSSTIIDTIILSNVNEIIDEKQRILDLIEEENQRTLKIEMEIAAAKAAKVKRNKDIEDDGEEEEEEEEEEEDDDNAADDDDDTEMKKDDVDSSNGSNTFITEGTGNMDNQQPIKSVKAKKKKKKKKKKEKSIFAKKPGSPPNKYLEGDEIYKVFSFDVRFGWIKTADLPKYESGEMRKYRAGDKDREPIQTVVTTPSKTTVNNNKPLSPEAILATSVVKDVFNVASANLHKKISEITEQFVEDMLFKSLENSIKVVMSKL